MSDFDAPQNNRSIGWLFVGMLVFFVVMMAVLTVVATQQALSRNSQQTPEAESTETLENCGAVFYTNLTAPDHQTQAKLQLSAPSTLGLPIGLGADSLKQAILLTPMAGAGDGRLCGTE